MEMTIERLRKFRGIRKEVEEMQREIDMLYYPIRSPRSSESHSATPSDPTASAVAKIMRKEAELEELRQTLADELVAIEDWVASLEDHELRAIIRCHYLMGDSWARCTQKILNYEFSDSAKHRVYRFFGLKQ